MKLKIIDTRGKTIELECNPQDKLSSLISDYENKYKATYPNTVIKTITLTFGGEAFTKDDYDINLEDLGLEDGCMLGSSDNYDGGLISFIF